jgi:hypothetical protein
VRCVRITVFPPLGPFSDRSEELDGEPDHSPCNDRVRGRDRSSRP